MEEVVIVVDVEGAATVTVNCVKGKACKDITKAIESALGKTTADVPTEEMKEVSRATHHR